MSSRLYTRTGIALGGCLTALVAALYTIFALNLLTPPRDIASLGATRVPTRLPIPTPTPTVLPPTPTLLLADDFSARKNWPRVVGAAPFGYTDQGYQLSPNVSDGFARVLLANFADKAAHDLSLELQAAPGPDSAAVEYGLLFWHSQDTDSREHFLYFGVSTNRAFRLRAYEPITPTTPTAARYRWVDLVTATSSQTINLKAESNRLRVDAHPHRVLAFVNDTLVLDLDSARLSAYRNRDDFDGRVGLIAVSLGEPNAQAVFTDFKLFADLKNP